MQRFVFNRQSGISLNKSKEAISAKILATKQHKVASKQNKNHFNAS